MLPANVRGRALAAVLLALAAGCSGPSATDTPPGPSAVEGRGQGAARAEVPATVTTPTQSPVDTAPASFAYVSETNQIAFFDRTLMPLLPNVQLEAIPNEIVSDEGLLVVGFPTGDLATIDVASREQKARTALTDLRAQAVGGDLILDELVRLSPGVVLVAGRLADAESGGYRAFFESRNTSDLSLHERHVLAPGLGVVQDLALAAPGTARALLSDGRLYDVTTRAVTTEPSGGEHSQVLRYGEDGRAWIGSGDSEPGVRTPAGVFVPLTAGRVTDIVPVGADRAAVFVSQPPQAWLVHASGDVKARLPIDDYPYAAAIVDDLLLVGSVNGSDIQALSLDLTTVRKRVSVGQGVVRLGPTQ